MKLVFAPLTLSSEPIGKRERRGPRKVARFVRRIRRTFACIACLFLVLDCGARSVAGGVGIQTLRIASPGERAQLISVPFLKASVARGRLNGVDAEAGVLTGTAGAFVDLPEKDAYLLRITDGPLTGGWFHVERSPGDPNAVRIVDDGLAGTLAELEGGEAFSVHPLFRLRELLPETSGLLPAAAIDVQAAQVHFFNGKGFEKYWLSNGTITDHRGWTYAENGSLKYAGEISILPGTSFVVVVPEEDEVRKIQVVGVVPDIPLAVPIFPGYNFIASHYSREMAGASFRLDELAFPESGFDVGGAESSDEIIGFDARAGKLGERYRFDQSATEFVAVNEGDAAEFRASPGSGFIVFNRGGNYLWFPHR